MWQTGHRTWVLPGSPGGGYVALTPGNVGGGSLTPVFMECPKGWGGTGWRLPCWVTGCCPGALRGGGAHPLG